LLDRLLQTRLVGLAELVGLRGQRGARGAVVAAREQRTLIVHDGDPLGNQPRHGSRDQMLDRLHLAAAEPAAALHAQRNRGARLDLVAPEQLVPGQDQVHPRRADVGERGDGAREFAFECPAQIDVGQEFGRAERTGLIEDLVADRAAAGQVVLGQRHAQAQRLVPRHQDRAAVALEPERHVHGLEPADDLGAVVELQPAVEQGVGGLNRAQHQVGKTGEQHEAGDAQDREPDRSEAAQRTHDPAARRGRLANGGRVGFGCRAGAERLIHRLVGLGRDALSVEPDC
jgi:hypothetical protein